MIRARSRLLDPGFFMDEKLCTLAPLTRLLFAATWGIADLNGVLENKPSEIKVRVLPYDKCDVAPMIATLVGQGFLTAYTVEGKNYLAVKNFRKYQAANGRERKSDFPLPPVTSGNCDAVTGNDDVIAVQFPVITSGTGTGTGTGTGSGTGDGVILSAPADRAREVGAHWERVMGRSLGRVPKAREARLAKVYSRLAEGFSVADLKRAIDGCAESNFHMGRDPRSEGKVYNDLTLICRNAAKVEEFFQRAEGKDGDVAVPIRKPLTAAEIREIELAEQCARDAEASA